LIPDHPQQDTRNPYYVYADSDLQSADTGSIMHRLCHALSLAGFEAYIAASAHIDHDPQTPALTKEITDRHQAEKRLPITIYPGSVDGNPMSSIVVVRYILDAAQGQMIKEIGGEDTDLLFYYSDEASHGANDANILTIALHGPLPEPDQLQQLIELTQQTARDQQRRLLPRVSDWLKARTLSTIQRRQLQQSQAATCQPGVMVIVRDKYGLAEPLRKTLTSVGRWRNEAAGNVGVHVLSVSSPAPQHAFGFVAETFAACPASQINGLLGSSDCQWLLMLDAGDELIESGTCMLDQHLGQTSASMVYCDEIHHHGRDVGAVFRPGVNLDYLISLPVIMAGHWLFNREALLACGGFAPQLPQAMEFDLILRLIETQGINSIEHIAEPLVNCPAPALDSNPDEIAALESHLRNRGYAAHHVHEYPARHYHVTYGHSTQPLVSIIIPTKDQLPLLRRCVESLLEKTRYFNYEVIIVDNNSQERDSITWLTEINAIGGQKIRVLSYPHPFNFSAINNFAVGHAHGEYLVLLNNDTAIIQEDWLDELLNHAQRPEVGIVGAKLLYPSGYIQHAGVIAGLGGPAGHPFIGLPAAAHGYMQRLIVDQNYSVVTAACLMIRRSVYDDVAGMDEEHFKVSYNDVDLCLKVGAQGYLTIWTPRVVLIHEGSVSQTQTDRASFAAKLKRFTAEQHAMYRKWLPTLANDPAYNRNLSNTGNGFDLEGRTEWSWRPVKLPSLPAILAHPADLSASAQRRIFQPFTALRDEGAIDGVITTYVPGVIDVERYQPDAIVLQRRLNNPRLEVLKNLKAFSNSFKTLDLDCLPSELEMQGAIQTVQSLVDRIVVSTPELADLLTGSPAQIVILATALGQHWAQPLMPRLPNSRLRIGCFVSNDRVSDLSLVETLMSRLPNVDWVLLGHVHPRLMGAAREVHRNVHDRDDRDALASLNLDLALIPLRDNLSNHCRDHSLLLEYGACAVPVICSDVSGFRTGLPVTRLGHAADQWLAEIAQYLHDTESRIKQGEALRRTVLNGWIQDASRFEASLQGWLP
jgi:GT2 family glycosyltransferase